MTHTARGAVVGLRGAVVGVRGAAVGVRGAAVGNIGIPTYVISRGAVVRQPLNSLESGVRYLGSIARFQTSKCKVYIPKHNP